MTQDLSRIQANPGFTATPTHGRSGRAHAIARAGLRHGCSDHADAMAGGADGTSWPAAHAPGPQWPRACGVARLFALGLACVDAGAEDVPRANGTGDWYGVGYDASHSYTSPDTVLPPLTLRWVWTPPAGRPVELLQAVSSHGALFVHGRFVAATALGDRSGAHTWSVNIDTGALVQLDPAGVTPNDWTYGFPIGTYGGEIYQADDGGPPHCSCDVWGPVEVSASERHWAVINQLHIDGPQPGIFCAHVGANYDAGWNIQTSVQRQHTGCFGVASIAAGRLFVIAQWAGQGPQFEQGLACYELDGGKRDWAVDGSFINVSSDGQWCVAAERAKVLDLYSARDGALLASRALPAVPACPPMIAAGRIGIYDVDGGWATYELRQAGGRRDLAVVDHYDMGRFSAPPIYGPFNCAFCRSADGTVYFAHGAAITAVPPALDAKRATYALPGSLAATLAPFGQPIIAHGRLIVVAQGGVACFDALGKPIAGARAAGAAAAHP
jgi:hypothetical protein